MSSPRHRPLSALRAGPLPALAASLLWLHATHVALSEVTDEGGRFASLAIPVYRRLLFGGVFNFLAMQISVIARAWLAFDLTGTNTALGGVLIGFGLASIIMIPTGGVLADRFPKRTVLLVTATMQTLISLVLAIAVTTNVVAYWMLVVASILQGAIISLLGPARLAFIAEAVDRERLTNAIFLSQSSFQLTRVLGPAAAGALIGVQTIGVAGVYYISAGCGVAGFLLTVGLPPGRPVRKSARSPWADLIDGARFVRSNPHILHLLVLSYLVVLIGFPHVAFLPVYSEEIFDVGSAGFGALTTAAALGALAASLTLADIDRAKVWRYEAAAAVLFGVTLVLLAVAPTFAMALVIMVAVGATSAAFQALNNSLVLTHTPVEYHGRMQSLLMLSFSGFGLAALPLGVLADAVGLRETVTGMGLAVLAVSLTSIAVRRRQPAPPAATL